VLSKVQGWGVGEKRGGGFLFGYSVVSGENVSVEEIYLCILYI
jgi:hypothetical protein